MARLLIVHHTSSPSRQAMPEAVVADAGTDGIDGPEDRAACCELGATVAAELVS